MVEVAKKRSVKVKFDNEAEEIEINQKKRKVASMGAVKKGKSENEETLKIDKSEEQKASDN